MLGSLLGCTSEKSEEAGVPGDSDSDSDGLTADEEGEYGTDPTNPDTDGDGYTDGEEAGAGSDPTNGFLWPEDEGNWPDFSDEAEAAGLADVGWSMGDTIHDIGFIDQFRTPCAPRCFNGFLG